MKRGEIWWAMLAEPKGAEPGYRRAAKVVPLDAFNQSAIQTVIVAAITSNLRPAERSRETSCRAGAKAASQRIPSSTSAAFGRCECHLRIQV
jgi:mRNA-degrading endonuclease toxin of MazEF toxin-antitoxin module